MNARMIVQTVITLASSALGFVAALAWNDAIKSTIDQVIGPGEGLGARYTYAVLATILAVVVIAVLGWIAGRVGGEATITREVG